MSLYDQVLQINSAEYFHIPAEEILMMADTMSVEEIISFLRKKLPGFFASERKTRKAKAKMNTSMQILKPKLSYSNRNVSKSITGLEINGHDGQCRRCPFTGRGAPQKISVFTASFALP